MKLIIPECLGHFLQLTPSTQAENCCDDCKYVLECKGVSERYELALEKNRKLMGELKMREAAEGSPFARGVEEGKKMIVTAMKMTMGSNEDN